MGGINNGLLVADVAHMRLLPKRNGFRYGVYYLCFALDELTRLGEAALLSLNRWNLFSFYAKDHGARDGTALDGWIRNILAQWQLPEANGRVVLLAMPRLFGYVFNPVSFWFCLDAEGLLRAVLSEVNNTFGDRHCYISFHDDHRPIAQDDVLQAQKIFHVSPFMKVEGHYRFRFMYREDKIGVWIDHYNAEGLLLTTSLTGKRMPLTSANLLRCFVRYPLVTLKVIGLIHYQAIKIWGKGIRYQPRPEPPVHEVSR